MTEADKASPQAVTEHLKKEWGPEVHLSEIKARGRWDGNGRLLVMSPNRGMFKDVIGPTLFEIDFSQFSVPVLAIRSMPRNAQEMFPGCFEWFDSENKQIAENTYQRWVRVVFTEGDRFVEGVAGVQELPLPGAHHEVHITEPERIIGPIRNFLLRNRN